VQHTTHTWALCTVDVSSRGDRHKQFVDLSGTVIGAYEQVQKALLAQGTPATCQQVNLLAPTTSVNKCRSSWHHCATTGPAELPLAVIEACKLLLSTCHARTLPLAFQTDTELWVQQATLRRWLYGAGGVATGSDKLLPV
jgi:hypothetical protein